MGVASVPVMGAVLTGVFSGELRRRIPPEAQARIFDRFFRGAPAAAPLGLSFVVFCQIGHLLDAAEDDPDRPLIDRILLGAFFPALPHSSRSGPVCPDGAGQRVPPLCRAL